MGLGGEGVRVSRPDWGPGEAARLTPQGFPIWTPGRGDVPSTEAAAQRRWGFAAGGPVAPSFLPAVGGRRVGGPPRVRRSSGIVGNSCAGSIPAPARAPSPPPRCAAPSNPHRSGAVPPAALSANTAFVCAGAPGLAVRAGGVCVSGGLGLGPLLGPAAGPPLGRTWRDTVSGGNPSPPAPPLRGVGGRRPSGRWGPGRRALARTAQPTPQFLHLKGDTQAGASQGPRVCSLSSRSLCPRSPPLRAAPRVQGGSPRAKTRRDPVGGAAGKSWRHE